jgi:hypothetical protein
MSECSTSGSDADLHPPQSWNADRQRCRDAGIPADVCYRPKWRIAVDQLLRLSGNGITFDWLVFPATEKAFRRFQNPLMVSLVNKRTPKF